MKGATVSLSINQSKANLESEGLHYIKMSKGGDPFATDTIGLSVSFGLALDQQPTPSPASVQKTPFQPKHKCFMCCDSGCGARGHLIAF